MSVFPGAIDSPDVSMQGTTLFTSDSHSLQHRTLGSAVIGIENFLGTNAASNVFTGFNFGDHAAKRNFDTFGSPTINQPQINGGTLTAPTITSVALTNPTISGGTFQSNIQNNGTVAAGVYGTAQITGGTIGSTTILQPLMSAFWALPGTSGQTFGTNQTTQVHLGSLNYDLLGEFGTANNQFVAKQAGLYQFTGFIDIANLTTGCDPQIRLNGTVQQGGALFLVQGGWVHWQGSVQVGGTVDFALLNLDTTHIGTEQHYGGGTIGFYGKRVF